VKEFQAAASLDPHFFEAQMNLAEINLSFRGFDKAEGAFRKALEMHANDYDAHLGLALALRGQIDETNYDKEVAAVQAELTACKNIDPARPDAYFNEGILTQEYKTKGADGSGGVDKAVAVYQQAKQIFQVFIEKAAGKNEYAGAVKKSQERMQDIDDTVTFLQAGGPTDTAAAPAASGSQAPAGSAAPAGSDSSGAASPPASAGAGAPAAAPAPAAKPPSK
jgi:tetratricopeptide (TPR) repeat protein